jgi:hypothetical protein
MGHILSSLPGFKLHCIWGALNDNIGAYADNW